LKDRFICQYVLFIYINKGANCKAKNLTKQGLNLPHKKNDSQFLLRVIFAKHLPLKRLAF
jgi:hypothetical protein